jgi:hypothetical protein
MLTEQRAAAEGIGVRLAYERSILRRTDRVGTIYKITSTGEFSLELLCHIC